MGLKAYPVIDLAATGDNIRRLIPVAGNPDIVCEQQAETCCSHCFLTGCSGCGKRPMQLPPFAPGARPAA